MISLAAVLPFLAVVHAVNHTIQVGLGPDGQTALAFDPPTVAAAIGDNLCFTFNPKNHSVTQSSFGSPCTPLDGGFDSGFMPTAPGMTPQPKFIVQVNDTKPIWVHCKQPGPPNHCQSGMVFAANAPPTGNTFDNFRLSAIGSGNASTTLPAASDTAIATPASDYTSPPPPVVETVTATVTLFQSTYTTTYASWEGAPADPTPNAQPAVHTVIVGGINGNVFTPNNVTAQMNDIVMFTFMQKNHTYTQSSFNNPCSPLNDANAFDSGFMPVTPTAATFPSYNITVNTTSPIWGYCRQVGHCLQGMVMGINPPQTGPNDMSSFIKLAMHSNLTNVGNSSPGSSSSSSSSSSPTPSTTQSGANRAAVSVGLGMGITGLTIAALL